MVAHLMNVSPVDWAAEITKRPVSGYFAQIEIGYNLNLHLRCYKPFFSAVRQKDAGSDAPHQQPESRNRAER